MVFARIEREVQGCRVERGFSFAAHTTVGAGGKAELCLWPESIPAAVHATGVLRREGVPFVILGAGANVLASDKGFCGAVICTAAMRAVAFSGEKIFAECGVRLSRLLYAMADEGLGGMAFMAGIPASVGGALYMNAGTAEGHIGDRVESVTVLTGSGEVKTLSSEDCAFSYKHTAFTDSGDFILGAELRGEYMCRVRALTDIADVLKERRRLPKGKSMGCVFKNPEGVSAGALIDRSGLKGARIGGAFVSDAHANFIINEGGTAGDIRALIAFVKQTVLEKTGVRLEEEIVYIGEE